MGGRNRLAADNTLERIDVPKYYDTLPDSLAGRGDFPEPGTYPGRLFERTDAARVLAARDGSLRKFLEQRAN